MVIIKLEVSEIDTLLRKIAEYKGISVDMLVSEIINKYFPDSHRIDVDAMAQGYKEMGEINLSIANGDNKKG